MKYVRPLTLIGRTELIEMVVQLQHERDELKRVLGLVVRRSVGDAGKLLVRPYPSGARPPLIFRFESLADGSMRLWHEPSTSEEER